MAFSLVWMEQALLGAGLKVAAQPGWKTRGHGDMGQVRGVMCHHTVGPRNGNMPSLGVITNGRPDLPGPLSQLGLGRDGTFYLIAAGRCFHAGRGNWQGFTSGNDNFIGIEAENTGYTTGPKAEPWPDVQMDAYRRGCAALLSHIRANAIMVCGHKEYALPVGRKPDPTFNMNEFRMAVAGIMSGAAPKPSAIPRVDAGGNPTLRRGSRGEAVKRVQAAAGVAQTGEFDGATEAAVREFQRRHKLVPDGIVGPRTWASIDQ